uniref:Uncharacterized protein n=1 Tax=Glossina palpalis gambiensis TaxID=67801 RepID=A0A1B0BSS4_9MUSC
MMLRRRQRNTVHSEVRPKNGQRSSNNSVKSVAIISRTVIFGNKAIVIDKLSAVCVCVGVKRNCGNPELFETAAEARQ